MCSNAMHMLQSSEPAESWTHTGAPIPTPMHLEDTTHMQALLDDEDDPGDEPEETLPSLMQRLLRELAVTSPSARFPLPDGPPHLSLPPLPPLPTEPAMPPQSSCDVHYRSLAPISRSARLRTGQMRSWACTEPKVAILRRRKLWSSRRSTIRTSCRRGCRNFQA